MKKCAGKSGLKEMIKQSSSIYRNSKYGINYKLKIEKAEGESRNEKVNGKFPSIYTTQRIEHIHLI